MPPKKNETQKFETALVELEKIVDKLENEDIDLDDAIKIYEEGVLLADFCSKKLNAVKNKISVLVEKNGVKELESFDNSEEE